MGILPSYEKDCRDCEKIAETGLWDRYSGLMKEKQQRKTNNV